MAAFTPIASSIAPSEDMDATDDEQAQAGQHGKGPSPIGGGGGHKAGHDENAKKKTGTSAKKRTTLPVRELKGAPFSIQCSRFRCELPFELILWPRQILFSKRRGFYAREEHCLLPNASIRVDGDL